ncbi:uncharacterized protein A4U43_C01F10140 [Asparagus officinalis]|uniref:Lunapark zinc ribbon domain-containing protein n=1 Tax=Asparagus officinalis TaxID=4686 RepID=A0A5P1FP44_ASPOF|nr:uncharacterized protein A4U43_C01F10140 [Asparagus officinalis]
MTCQLLGVILEERSPEELQKQAIVKPSVLEVLQEISKICDESEERVLLALDGAGLFATGALTKDRVLFCSTDMGRSSFVRQLEPDWHVDSNLEIVSQLAAMAVAYAIMTTRSVDLDWKMRAARVFPMFGLPMLSALIYSSLVSFTRMLDRKDQKTLERLRAERQAKIDELKERTNYYTTQQLIQRYDLDPAAKAAAATVLASKLGADSGLKVYLGDESNNPKGTMGRSKDAELERSAGLRNRRPSHIRSNSTGNAALTQYIDETSVDYSADGEESPDQNQRVVEHFKGPSPNDGGWLARIAALLVGEDPSQCYALICGNCHMHNGLARKEDYPYVTYYCPHCHTLNGSRQPGENVSSLSSDQATPTNTDTPTQAP